MKALLAICLLSIAATVAQSQTAADAPATSAPQPKPVCGLNLSQLQLMGGLRLGLSRAEVLALFPGIEADDEVRASLAAAPTPLGVSSLIIRPERSAAQAKFQGVRQISLTFLDDRVSGISIGYNGPQFKHVDEFIESLSKGTNLPETAAWEAVIGLDTQSKKVTCNGAEITVFAGGEGGSLNSVQMLDTAARQTLKERRAKARAQSNNSQR